MRFDTYSMLLGLLIGVLARIAENWYRKNYYKRVCPWNDQIPREVNDEAHKGLVNSTSEILRHLLMPSDDEIERQLDIYKEKYPNIYGDVTVKKVKEWYKQDLGIPTDCTREAGHTGPCNGYAVRTCPAFEISVKVRGLELCKAPLRRGFNCNLLKGHEGMHLYFEEITGATHDHLLETYRKLEGKEGEHS